MGGASSSDAIGISDNGQVVVGRSEGKLGFEAFRWTDVDKMVSLGGRYPCSI